MLSALALLISLTLLDGSVEIDNASPAESLQHSEAEYHNGNYQTALSGLDRFLKTQPNNDVALYYRANTLIKLGLRSQALLDYQQACKYTSSQSMRNYCLLAISSLTKNITMPTINPTLANLSPTEHLELNRSLGTIQLQSALDKVRIIDTGELSAQDSTMKQRIKLAQMQQETEQIMQQMQDAVYYDRFGHKRSTYSPLDIQRFQNERLEQQQALTQAIQQASTNQTQSAQKQAELSQESARNLENQLVGNGLPEGIKLSPLGTNLYVRNYDTIPNKPLPKLPTELTAAEKKLK